MHILTEQKLIKLIKLRVVHFYVQFSAFILIQFPTLFFTKHKSDSGVVNGAAC